MGRGKSAVKDSFSDILGERRGSDRTDTLDWESLQLLPVYGDWKDIRADSGVFLLFPRDLSIQHAELNLVYEKLMKMERDMAPVSLPSKNSIFISSPDLPSLGSEYWQDLVDEIGGRIGLKAGSILPYVPARRVETNLMYMKQLLPSKAQKS
jgi:hypothetical protein